MARLPGQTRRHGRELRHGGQRIVAAEHVEAVAGPRQAQRRGERVAPGWGGEEGVGPPAAQDRRDPDELEAEIARANARHGASVRARVEPAPEMKLEKAQREVDPALDGEWQRAPDA